MLDKNDTAAATREELETIKLRVESLSAQLQQHQNDVRTLPVGETGGDR